MQLSDVLCYIILTVTVTTSCVGAEDQQSELEESYPGRRLIKRDATLILDNYPMDRIFQKPKVIYRRISKQRYGPPKSKYGAPKPKYRPPKAPRKHAKKTHRKSKPKASSPKYGPRETISSRKRIPKPKYGPPPKARKNPRPGLGRVVKMPHYSYFLADNTGYAERPLPYIGDYQHPKQSYGEPPVDSYGAPIRTSIKDVFSTPQSFQGSAPVYDDFNGEEYQSWSHLHNKRPDSKFPYTKNKATISSATNQIYVTPTHQDYNDESLNTEVTEKLISQDNPKLFFRKKKPFYFADSKFLNKPWTPNKQDEMDDQVVVGGQYAEPPARYVAKYQQSPMYEDDEDEDTFVNPLHGYVDSEMPLSAHTSPYTNYKHSNMAFSPQNLNDAFSIVDK